MDALHKAIPTHADRTLPRWSAYPIDINTRLVNLVPLDLIDPQSDCSKYTQKNGVTKTLSSPTTRIRHFDMIHIVMSPIAIFKSTEFKPLLGAPQVALIY